jgi:hypothetical protein
VSDKDGAEKRLYIQFFAPLTIRLSRIDLTSYNGNNSSIDLTIKAGVAPFIISRSNGSTKEDISNLESGYYGVTVRDANSVSKSSFNSVYEPYEDISTVGKILSNITRLSNAGLWIIHQGKIIYIDPINIYPEHTNYADIILITHAHWDHFSTPIITQL